MEDIIKVSQKQTILKIELNRPEKLNAINEEMLLALKKIFTELNESEPSGLRLINITGACPKAFSVGADIKDLSQMSPNDLTQLSSLAHEVFNLIEACPLPVIAGIEGYALGGGLELALSCDFIFAKVGTLLGQPEAKLGLIPGFGGCIRLTERVGRSVAKRLIFTSKLVDTNEAFIFGLIDQVVDKDSSVEQAVDQFMLNILNNSSSAISLTKRVINEMSNTQRQQNFNNEQLCYTQSFTHKHGKIGIDAFLKKITPLFRT